MNRQVVRLLNNDITPTEKLVLIAIYAHISKNNISLSYNDLSRITGLSTSSIKRSIKTLKDRHLILKSRAFGMDGEHIGNRYVIVDVA